MSSKMSAVGFEPTSSKTLRPERNPLDHSGKLTRRYLHLSTTFNTLTTQHTTNNTRRPRTHNKPHTHKHKQTYKHTHKYTQPLHHTTSVSVAVAEIETETQTDSRAATCTTQRTRTMFVVLTRSTTAIYNDDSECNVRTRECPLLSPQPSQPSQPSGFAVVQANQRCGRVWTASFHLTSCARLLAPLLAVGRGGLGANAMKCSTSALE